jgi:hypothetical protein
MAVISEFLREEQRDGEIAQEQDGNDQGNECDGVDLHGDLPQLLAGLDVKKRQDEERGGEQQHGYVLHRKSPGPASQQAGADWTGSPAQPNFILACGGFERRKDFLNKP